jgi:hypothetical protein
MCFTVLHDWSYGKYAGRGVNLNGMCAATARISDWATVWVTELSGFVSRWAWSPPASCLLGVWDVVPGLKRQGREAEHFVWYRG